MTYVTLSESSSLGVLNIIDNGGMEIWQRGTTFTNPVNAVYTADRWRTFGGASSTWTISQETSIIPTGGSQSKAMKIVITAVSESILGMLYYIENWTDYVGKTITVSAQVRSTVAGKISVIINDGQQANGAYNTLTNTYETITVSKKIVDIGQNRIYIAIGQVDSVVTPVPLTYYIDNVMCTIGSQAVTFVPTNPQIDFARCQRYYQQYGGLAGGSAYPIAEGVETGTTSGQVFLRLPVIMRTNPTITVVGGFGGNYLVQAVPTGNVTVTALAGGIIGQDKVRLDITAASGMVSNTFCVLYTNSTSAFVQLSADL